MATSEEVLNARFRAKMEARNTGEAPVFAAPPQLSQGESPESLDARFREKLAKHALGPREAAPASAKADKVAPEDSDAVKGKKPEAKADKVAPGK
jgi:hypothetical protein